MQIRHYIPSDAPAVLQLWNTAGVHAGYVPQDEAGLRALLLAHSDFSAAHTFVLDVDGQAQGFINGCIGAHLAQGAVRGYVSCLLLSEALDTDENARVLLTALEDSFRQAIYVAIDVFRNRLRDKAAHANPLRKQYYEKRDDSDKLKLDSVEEDL